ncbi:hypothetical protein [Fulvivirga sedimenti]|uniref:Uncharacterized protein n=1 Tax=Fulvivirga sedimenti TaxID=2879465 RepID=A0A9X1HY56_9BACT|nr:hypothetical protein [Fulvivirga sedimenti]MCA6078882.1 hypothetical protein [Fulvivirga sedimenti]
MKFIRSVLFLVFFLSILFWLSYNYFIPRMVADSIEKGELPSFIPKKLEPAFENVRERIDDDIRELPVVLNEHQLSYDDLIELVKDTRASEVVPVIQKFQEKDVTDPDQAFDIIVQYLGHKVDKPETFRNAFKERFNQERLQTAMTFMNNSDLPLEMNMELAKKITLEILKDRREEIESELKDLHQ